MYKIEIVSDAIKVTDFIIFNISFKNFLTSVTETTMNNYDEEFDFEDVDYNPSKKKSAAKNKPAEDDDFFDLD